MKILFGKKLNITLRLPDFKKNFELIETNKAAREAVDNLIASSRLQLKFFVMCGLSGMLATLGILLNDTAILIGAMVLAPILNPVLAFAAGISLFNRRLIIYATKSFFGGVFFVVIISAVFVKILLLSGQQMEVAVFVKKFRSFDMYFLLSALISGYAGVYAWLRPTNQSNLVGVAIAVSLIPFVSFFGILIGKSDFDKIGEFLFAFILNLFLIIFGATLAFLMLGFRQANRGIEKKEADLML